MRRNCSSRIVIYDIWITIQQVTVYSMGSFGGYYKGEMKKLKKKDLERKAQKQIGTSSWTLPKVEIIKKGKKDW
jgi:hypothetical protein